MKWSIAIFAFILIAFQVPAQQTLVDSLRKKLGVAKDDTTKVMLLNQLCRNFSENKPDSSLFYGDQALELSRKINYNKGEINALLNTSFGFAVTSNYSKALENGLEALKKAKRCKTINL